jgi:hypothetical protein
MLLLLINSHQLKSFSTMTRSDLVSARDKRSTLPQLAPDSELRTLIALYAVFLSQQLDQGGRLLTYWIDASEKYKSIVLNGDKFRGGAWNYRTSTMRFEDRMDHTRDIFESLLFYYVRDYQVDLSVFTYLIATWCWENGGLQIIDEVGGSSKAYSPYYGRDILHTTLSDNYKRASLVVSSTDRLFLDSPDLMKIPSYASKIALDIACTGWNSGMSIPTAMWVKSTEQWKESDLLYYNNLSPKNKLYARARRAINSGNSRWIVAEYALEFDSILNIFYSELANMVRLQDTSLSLFYEWLGCARETLPQLIPWPSSDTIPDYGYQIQTGLAMLFSKLLSSSKQA